MTSAQPRFRSKKLALQSHSSAEDRYLVPDDTIIPGGSSFAAQGAGGNVGKRSMSVSDGQ